MKRTVILFLFLIAASCCTQAQISKAPRAYFDWIITATHADRRYNTGEKAGIKILAFAGGVPLEGIKVSFEAGNDMFPADTTGTVMFHDGTASISFGSMDQPGYRYCNIRFRYNDKNYKETVKVAFSPEKIESLTPLPGDFRKFWDKTMKQAAKVPMQAEITPLPDKSTDKVEMSLVKLQCSRKGRYIYGYLSKPRSAGKHPVLLVPPGAGVKRTSPSSSYAEEGFITLSIEIHGISPFASDEEMRLRQKEIGDYAYKGLEDKDKYYFKDVYMGCIRGLDFLCSLPEFDGKNVGVCGGSQGGALSIVTAGLDKRVNFVSAFYPALCDLTGFKQGRAGGWPRIGAPGRKNEITTDMETAFNTLAYYDVVNFARMLTVPGFYSFGYKDNTCPPTSVTAAVNAITAPKTVIITPVSAHWRFSESNMKSIEWMKAQLKE